MHARCVALAATGADRTLAFFAGALVQLHAQLRGTLKNVKELPKWKIEQSRNHGDRVQNGNEIVEASCRATLATPSGPSPVIEMAKSKISGQKSMAKVCTARAPSSRMRRHSESAIPPRTKNGCNIESMKKKQRSKCMQMETASGKPEQVRDVRHLIVRGAGEVDPSEYQRERDQHRQHASPKDHLMHRPAQSGAFRDECLGKQMSSCQSVLTWPKLRITPRSLNSCHPRCQYT